MESDVNWFFHFNFYSINIAEKEKTGKWDAVRLETLSEWRRIKSFWIRKKYSEQHILTLNNFYLSLSLSLFLQFYEFFVNIKMRTHKEVLSSQNLISVRYKRQNMIIIKWCSTGNGFEFRFALTLMIDRCSYANLSAFCYQSSSFLRFVLYLSRFKVVFVNVALFA